MPIFTRVGKYARCGSKRRKKTSAIKLHSKHYGKRVVVLTILEYRNVINASKRLRGLVLRVHRQTLLS